MQETFGGMGVKSSGCVCLWNSAVYSCILLHFGPAGWAWPNRSKIVTLSEKSHFSLEWGWCCLQHPQAGQQNLLLLRLYWFQKKSQLFGGGFFLCSFTIYSLVCSARALPRDIPLVSPGWHRVTILSEIVCLPNRVQILMWKHQPTLENTLTHF